MIEEYIFNFYGIISRVWLYVLVGFLLNILIQLLVPAGVVIKHFKKNKFVNIIKAAGVGAVLSVCSYGAVPIIASFRKKGASTASCLTMLLASPWVGVLQLVIIKPYIGFSNTIIFFFTSLILAVGSGLIFSYLEENKIVEERKRITWGLMKKCHCGYADEFLKEEDRFKEIISLMINISKNLVIGLLITALIKTVFVPAEVTTVLAESNIFSIIYAVPIATLVESVGEGLGVVAGELYLMGASLGAVFTIIITGVTTDITELMMIDSIFGKKTATYYSLINTVLVVIIAYLMNGIL